MRARMSALARKDRPVGREAGNYVEKREEEGEEEEKPGLHRPRGAFASPSLLPPAPLHPPHRRRQRWPVAVAVSSTDAHFRRRRRRDEAGNRGFYRRGGMRKPGSGGTTRALNSKRKTTVKPSRNPGAICAAGAGVNVGIARSAL